MKSAVAMAGMLIATAAFGECVGQPSVTVRGWKSISAWTLPGDVYGVAYVCSGADRKIVVERFGNRIVRDVRYVSDLTLPKLGRGEVLLEGCQCARHGKADPFIVPFGQYTRRGVARVSHAWRVELPHGTIATIDAKSVRCEVSKGRF